MEKFEIGKIVQLKSGGPLMTIEGIRELDKIVECIWFDGSHVVRAIFHYETLNCGE